jgi:hypothetical protein
MLHFLHYGHEKPTLLKPDTPQRFFIFVSNECNRRKKVPGTLQEIGWCTGTFLSEVLEKLKVENGILLLSKNNFK